MSLKTKILISSAGLFAALSIFNLVIIETSFRESFSKINSPYFEPILLLSLTIMVSVVIVSLFGTEIFNRWFNTFFKWGVPVCLILTFLMEPGISYGSISRTGMAMLLGEILIASTLVFALVQKFYFKR